MCRLADARLYLGEARRTKYDDRRNTADGGRAVGIRDKIAKCRRWLADRAALATPGTIVRQSHGFIFGIITQLNGTRNKSNDTTKRTKLLFFHEITTPWRDESHLHTHDIIANVITMGFDVFSSNRTVEDVNEHLDPAMNLDDKVFDRDIEFAFDMQNRRGT